MATLDVSATETIERPLADVWELASDASRYSDWVPATLEMTRIEPLRLGATYEERTRIVGPLTSKSLWKVIEFEPMSRQVHRDESIPVAKYVDVVMGFEDVDGERTKMTLGLQGESALGPVGALLISTMRSSFDKDNQTALRNFKALAEAG